METIHGDQIKEEDAAVPASKFSRLYQLVPFPGRADDMQKVWNAIVVNGSDSMRIDIPKHDVLPGYRRAEGRQYPMLGFVDPKPAGKYYWELVEKAGLEKGKQ